MQPAFIGLFNLTPYAKFIYVSESICEVLGHEPAEVISKSWLDFYHPDEVDSIMGLFLASIRDNTFGSVLVCRMRHKTGRYISVEIDQFHRVISLPEASIEDCEDPSLEPRVCLIIDRFTKLHIIQYTSKAASFLLGYETTSMIGTSFLSYVVEEDISIVQNMLLATKAVPELRKFSFGFQSSFLGEILMEAISSGCSDSLMLVLRPNSQMPFLK
ncbi:hypothetical protein K7432_008334 [Basidiobolus ranarum]|uniref:PAS domain-containing protein n=1 Tax=Basidiobolus ranarum TaxID=34480 RepID=A0ABR2VZ64_9FUNG